MEEYELIGRISELEGEVAFLEEQMAQVWLFLRHASQSETELGRSCGNFFSDLRKDQAKHRDEKRNSP
jgi:hypothetical protein